jgi:hypothetical protein
MPTTITINGQTYLIEEGAGGYTYYRVASTQRFGKKVKAKGSDLIVWNGTDGTPDPNIGLGQLPKGSGGDYPSAPVTPPPSPAGDWSLAAMNDAGEISESSWLRPNAFIDPLDGATTELQGLTFNETGTKMFWFDGDYRLDTDPPTAFEYGESPCVIEWDLSDAWNPSSTVGSATLHSLRGIGAPAADTMDAVYVPPNGLYLYMTDWFAGVVYQWNMSSAYDFSSLSFVGSTDYSSARGFLGVTAIFVSDDGSKMFLCDGYTEEIAEYALGTDYNAITGVTYIDTYDYSIGTGTRFQEMRISPDGLKLFLMDTTQEILYEFALDSAWDITPQPTILDGVTYAINIEGRLDSINYAPAQSLFTYNYTFTITQDGSYLYMMCEIAPNAAANHIIEQFDLNAEPRITWDLSAFSSTPVGSLDVSFEDTNPYGLAMNDDGTKAYIVGGNKTIYAYDLGTPYLISSGSYSGEFADLSAQSPVGFGLFDLAFKPDGTKFWVISDQQDKVFEYDCATPWLVSTASVSYNSVFYDYSSDDSYATTLEFNPSGTKMYIAGLASNNVGSVYGQSDFYEYDLSPAWDITSASYVDLGNVYDEDDPQCARISPDGDKMIVGGNFNKALYEYDLLIPWTINSINYASKSLSYLPMEQPVGMVVTTNADKMYIVDDFTSLIYEFNT